MSRRLAIEIGALALAALLALLLRMWAIGIYLIPSASMLPRLMPGDYLLVEKWPFAAGHRSSRRGEVVVVRIGAETYTKRVIALPGDRVALRDGRLILNDEEVARWRVADFLFARSPEMTCYTPEPQPKGPPLCRAIRYREMPQHGAPRDVIDLGPRDGDDFGPVTVPARRLFLLGDNRDRSADSRTTLGMVSIDAMVGRAGPILVSIDPAASLAHPSGWWKSIRWSRIGTRG